jgi:hypothetical protein
MVTELHRLGLTVKVTSSANKWSRGRLRIPDKIYLLISYHIQTSPPQKKTEQA